MVSALNPLAAAVLIAASAAVTAALIVVLRPLLVRYALARPNARSSHTIPTPQGGGIAIVLTVLAAIAAAAVFGLPGSRELPLAVIALAVLVLAVIGTVDDIRPLPVLPRLAGQLLVAAALIAVLPAEARALPILPLALERIVLIIGLVWFINLTNFMDGIDWMTVVEAVPILTVLVVLAMSGLVPARSAMLVPALALLGGLLGFAPFNRHVAKLFLGDVGSLPVGMLLGWLLIVLASDGFLIAALILPLYYLADATLTLIWRFHRGERVSEGHRSHFYQTAVRLGFSVPRVTAMVFALNVVLAVLATLAAMANALMAQLVLLAIAALATALVLREFARGPRR
ncbi:MAG: glycosyltransferase family 4 protein [Hyphomicrobiaceae bacterium]